MADKVQVDQSGTAVIYEEAAKVQANQAGVVVIYDLDEYPEVRVALAGITIIYSEIPEEIEVNLGLAQVDVIPLPLSVQLGRRQYPVPTTARGYGAQNKRVFPTVK